MELINGKVVLSKEEFQEYLLDSMRMAALEQGGVDNWSWYSESLKEMDEWIEEWNEEKPELKIVY